MAGNIFISYRRDDSKHAAGRLVDRLHAEFDEGQIFLDVDNIELGLDFVEVLNERVAACDIMLVIIGPSWLTPSEATTRHRLENPNDFVRLEIEAALKRNIRVVPVLVDGAEPPRAEDLPESLAPLANRQATRLSHESFNSDANALTTALARIVRSYDGDSCAAPERSTGLVAAPPMERGQLGVPIPADTSTGAEGGFREGSSASHFVAARPVTNPEPSSDELKAAPTRRAAQETDPQQTDAGQDGRSFDVAGWLAALGPAIFGAMLFLFIATFNPAPNDFAFFGLDGEKVAFSLPLLGTLVLWIFRGMSSRPPVSGYAKIVGILLIAANIVVVIMVR